MNAGMFYKGVRSLLTSLVAGGAVLTACPAFAMNVGLGDTVKFTRSPDIYRVLGARIADANHVTLELENVNSGVKLTIDVERGLSLDDVPGLTWFPQGHRGVQPYY